MRNGRGRPRPRAHCHCKTQQARRDRNQTRRQQPSGTFRGSYNRRASLRLPHGQPASYASVAHMAPELRALYRAEQHQVLPFLNIDADPDEQAGVLFHSLQHIIPLFRSGTGAAGASIPPVSNFPCIFPYFTKYIRVFQGRILQLQQNSIFLCSLTNIYIFCVQFKLSYVQGLFRSRGMDNPCARTDSLENAARKNTSAARGAPDSGGSGAPGGISIKNGDMIQTANRERM